MHIKQPKAVVLMSGGMDSATALWLTSRTRQVYPLAFDYGQRHAVELDYAMKLCVALSKAVGESIPLNIVPIPVFAKLAPNSSQTGGMDVPEGHYADETMRATVVPNRNMVMLSIAVAYAIGIGAGEVVAGMHAGDHPVYPDCRPEFVDAFNACVSVGNYDRPILNAPFIRRDKADIVKMGAPLLVPYELTWSCYKGGAVHCGKCGTCVERREAFQLAGVPDPTTYEGDVTTPLQPNPLSPEGQHPTA